MTILQIENNEPIDEPGINTGSGAGRDTVVARRRYIWSVKLHKKALKKRGKRRQKSKHVAPKKQKKFYPPVVFTFTERYSKPVTDMFKQWVDLAWDNRTLSQEITKS